ncbi:hypothetical protein O181_062238 [Austropuccinia psidii MF-1]|uniref:CCHC-type domain-containing protein n=1 Tax=Austropuccinia psidii MF-1 TaxID=1389203 RepID=A0A9Q3EPD1_9BASI|nr:hypothetical protein [Austropuccinia psidii MF-1]
MRLNKVLVEFKNRGGVFNNDYVMGQLLQHAIIKRPTVYQALMDRLDVDTSYGKIVSLPSCILTLESCFQCPATIKQIPSFNSMSLEPSSAVCHKLELTPHSALRMAMNIICHLCQQRGHVAKDCLNTKDNHCAWPISTPPVVNPILTPTQFHAHYPIITPPTKLPFQALQQPISNATRQQRLADLYCPQYPQQMPMVMKAKFTEIGPADLTVDEVTVDDMAPPGDRGSVCDTGASHLITGDLASLCCFKKLTSPIPLCVATHTTQQSFVTGVGSLVYPGYRGKHVVINGVFYSPDATGTLISPGALLNANALLNFIGDDILISTRGEGPVLRATYSASGHKWELPLYSRLLACAMNTSYSPTISPAKSIETINLPAFSKMTLDAMNKKIPNPKCKINTDPSAFKAEFLKWHCLFGHTGL